MTFSLAAPSISSITTTTPNGNYKAGDAIQLQIDFNENITVTGTPTLTMNTTGEATFLTSANDKIDFNYIISANQNATNLKVSTLSGTITSTADGNSADLTITSNLADGILVDTNGPSCTITTPTSTDYNSTTISGLTLNFYCSDSGVGMDKNTALLDGSPILNGAPLSGVSANVSHTITIDANDILGNNITQKSVSFIYDTNAPTGTISAHSLWTNSAKPQFDINATHHSGAIGQLQMAFSCFNANEDTNWTSWVNYAATYSDFNTHNINYGCAADDWNKTIYIKFKDAAGNIDSNRYHTTQFYDNTAPSAPTSLSASAGNAKVTLSWTEPVADNRSGNSRVYAYKNGSTTNSCDVNYGTTSCEITGLTNGTTYTFKLRTKDVAGNYSDYTSEVNATPATATATITIKKNNSSTNLDYAKNGDSINIECSYSASVSGAKIVAKTYSPTSSDDILEESSSSTSTLETDFSINFNSSQEKIVFWCEATSVGDSSIKTIYIDNIKPTISWVDTNNTFIGTKRVTAKASDDRYFDKVEFDFNKVIYNSLKDSNNNYYFDLNTVKYENGTYTIKAIAYDRSGNKTEITRSATFENIQTPKQKAEKAISDAKAKQKTANDLIKYFQTESLIVPEALNAKKVNADNLLNTAISTLIATPESALTSATQAITLYDEFNKAAKVETTETKNYVIDSNNLAENLTKLGFTNEQTQQAINYINSTSITRKLIIVKAGDEAKRQVRIELSFTNDTNETLLKIIEIIPKELVDSAKKIVSDANFRIVQEDPIIEFTVPAQKGAKVTLSYGIGEITKEAADKMIADNVIAKFTNPPILTLPTVKTEEVVGKALFSGTLTIAVIVLIILVIVAIIGAALFLKFRHPKDGHGFGEEKTIVEHLTPQKEEEKPKWSAP